jgi:S-adenosylmethionine:tRNA ribosyltransferase-isomerase
MPIKRFKSSDNKGITQIKGETSLMIVPGYTFKLVEALITNFHLPKSTLLMLISAFVGDINRKKIYNHALANDYRFLSYGDSSLLVRPDLTKA